MPKLEITPKVVLAIGAHADDLEFWAGGTLAQWVAAGAIVFLLVLTTSDNGTADPSLSSDDVTKIRQEEQRAAAQLIGVTEVFFGNFEDCELEYSLREARRMVVKYIRLLKPDVVIGWDPTFVYSAAWQLPNHLDHRAAGLATLDATYPLARDALTYPELGKPHIVPTLLLINPTAATHFCDIEESLDTKLRALGSHASQTGLTAEKGTLDLLHASGQPEGLEVAEGFVYLELPPGQ